MKAERPSIGFVIVLAFLTAAPTVGDVGGCGAAADPLDASKYFRQKNDLVRDRCDECDVRTVPCKQAHDKNRVIPSTFPRGCAPVVHDGEVCLRALESLSCDAFAQSVVENDAVIPTECDFCPDDAGAP